MFNKRSFCFLKVVNMKQFVATLACLYSCLSLACTNAVPTNDPNFCSSFSASASCFCAEQGLPSSTCNDLNKLYDRMVFVYGSLDKACSHQKQTSPQDCIDTWTCYRNGGVDSKGNTCSGTGLACRR